jgi:hypothetical protein
MGNWLSATEGLVAGAVAVVGFLYTYASGRRSQYDRVLSLTAESGRPPVADDRHIAGMAFEPLSKHLPGQPVQLKEAEIKAVFGVLWYFERVSALYVSLSPMLRRKHITRTQTVLLDSLGSALTSWETYLRFKWVDEDGEDIEKDLATIGPLCNLIDKHERVVNRPNLNELCSPVIASLNGER